MLVVGDGFRQRGFHDLLVQLGQLAAQADRAPAAKSGSQIVQRGAQFVRCFVKNQRAGFVLQKGEPGAALLFRHGQKALKHKVGGGLPAGGQRRHAGGRPRHRHDPDAALVCFAHDLLAGVADAGHPGIAAQGAVFARLNALQDRLTVVQGVFVIADHRLFQAQMVQKPQCDAGILGGDKIRRAEGRRHAGRHIVQIADGCCHQIQSPAQNVTP